MKNLLFICIAALLTSCATTVNVSKRKHRCGYYVSVSKNKAEAVTKSSNLELIIPICHTEIDSIGEVFIMDHEEENISHTQGLETKTFKLQSVENENMTVEISRSEVSSKLSVKNQLLVKGISKKPFKNNSPNGDFWTYKKKLYLILLLLLIPIVIVFPIYSLFVFLAFVLGYLPFRLLSIKSDNKKSKARIFFTKTVNKYWLSISLLIATLLSFVFGLFYGVLLLLFSLLVWWIIKSFNNKSWRAIWATLYILLVMQTLAVIAWLISAII